MRLNRAAIFVLLNLWKRSRLLYLFFHFSCKFIVYWLFSEKHGYFVFLFHSERLNSFKLKVIVSERLRFAHIHLLFVGTLILVIICPYPFARAFVALINFMIILKINLVLHIEFGIAKLDFSFRVIMKQLMENRSFDRTLFIVEAKQFSRHK